MSKIRVFLADDHAVLRSGLRLLLDSQSDMEVVGEAGDFAGMLDLLQVVDADIVTLDLTMPGGLGLAAIQKIHTIAPCTRVIVLTMHDDPAYLRTALAMGTSGYVVKSVADTELISAIRAVHQGRVFVDARSSTAAEGLGSPNPSAPQGESLIDTLSSREREVLSLISQGHTNQAVADRLDISVKTVESYRGRLMNKLGLKNRADLTRFAIEHGLLASGPSEPSL
jgi:two-component system, NarL family, response regulator NreC